MQNYNTHFHRTLMHHTHRLKLPSFKELFNQEFQLLS